MKWIICIHDGKSTQTVDLLLACHEAFLFSRNMVAQIKVLSIFIMKTGGGGRDGRVHGFGRSIVNKFFLSSH
jgi:hypothetical protein